MHVHVHRHLKMHPILLSYITGNYFRIKELNFYCSVIVNLYVLDKNFLFQNKLVKQFYFPEENQTCCLKALNSGKGIN